jgi:metal-sulfur cluster biosynthetic enzyme
VSLRAHVLAALGTVYDPELDEPITALGFVGTCTVSGGGDVDVHLRLPTPQCAPNFAFLMVADARDAVRRLPAVGDVRIALEDHYTGDEINAAVARGGEFADAFPGETEGGLDALRELFRRKALLARQARVCAALVATGTSHEQIAAMCVRDLPDTQEARRCVALRRELGLPHAPDAPALVAGNGASLLAEEIPNWLRRARLVSLSLETNGEMCRSLLAVRYGHCQSEEVAA